jgi:hypothetical protein
MMTLHDQQRFAAFVDNFHMIAISANGSILEFSNLAL